MAVTFTPLPPEVFPKEARLAVARLNAQLSDLFALEGTIRNPATARRSDSSIVRNSGPQVALTRVTPAVSSAAASTASVTVGIPALSFGTANAVGSTTSVVSINSSVALFGTQAPIGISLGSASGTSAYAARGDHVHSLNIDAFLPTTTTGDLIVYGSTNNVRMAAGADKYVLTGYSASATGLTWTVPRHRLLAAYQTASTITGTTFIQTFTSETFSIGPSVLSAGDHARWTYRGVLGSSNVATTMQFDFIAGITTLATTGSKVGTPSLVNREWEAIMDVTCKSDGPTGTLEAQGWFRYANTTTAQAVWQMVNTATFQYDTTTAAGWSLQVTLGNVDTNNFVTLRQRIIELMQAP